MIKLNQEMPEAVKKGLAIIKICLKKIKNH